MVGDSLLYGQASHKTFNDLLKTMHSLDDDDISAPIEVLEFII